jgi:hypothetical protein
MESMKERPVTETNPVQSAVARLAVAMRPDRPRDPARVADARNGLVSARLEREIRRALEPADPDYEPLRRADRRRLASLLLEG